MLKTLLLIFALFFLITTLYSQDELNNQFVEENGMAEIQYSRT